eukprot:1145946-Pelagomonas_calceolata.AAC.1
MAQHGRTTCAFEILLIQQGSRRGFLTQPERRRYAESTAKASARQAGMQSKGNQSRPAAEEACKGPRKRKVDTLWLDRQKDRPHSSLAYKNLSSSARQEKIKSKTTQPEETLLTSIRKKETHWLKRSVSPLHHKAMNLKVLMGIWRVIGSTRFQDLAVRSITVFNSAPCGDNLVGILKRTGMKFASKFNGTLEVQPQLLRLVKGMLSIKISINVQENGGVRDASLHSVDVGGCVVPLWSAVLLRNTWCEQEEEEEE